VEPGFRWFKAIFWLVWTMKENRKKRSMFTFWDRIIHQNWTVSACY